MRNLFTPALRRDTAVLSAALFLVICANLFVVNWTASLLADLSHTAHFTSGSSAAWSIGACWAS